METKFLWVIVLTVFVIAAAFVYFNQPRDYYQEIYHNHADFAVYLNGAMYNFSQEKYMTSENVSLSHNVHMHDVDGSIIHMHAPGIKLKDFFQSIGMNFTSECFVLDNRQGFCANAKNKLLFYVNGKQNYDYGQYEPKDLDRLLITYGDGDVQAQLESVSDRACIYSLKCPERGTPPDESCVSTKNCFV